MSGLIERSRALLRTAAYAVLGARGTHRLTHRSTPVLTSDDRGVIERFHTIAYEKPMEALLAFMQEDRRFEIDRSREKFLLTFFPSGWLKRV